MSMLVVTPSITAVIRLLAVVMVVLAAIAVVPATLAPADDCVTTTLWEPSVRPLPLIVEIPYAVPPLATSTDPLAAIADVLDSVPLLTSAPAVARRSTVKLRLPTLAPVVADAVTTDEFDDLVVKRSHPVVLLNTDA